MTRDKRLWLVWALCALIITGILYNLSALVSSRPATASVFDALGEAMLVLMGVVFALLATLIITRQPRNVIGWLLLCPALASSVPVDSYLSRFPAAPAEPSFTLLAAVWLSGVGWLLLIFPLLFIPVLFPTGRPPSPRWRWLIVLGLAMCAFLIVFSALQTDIGPIDGGWTVPNPIGFLSQDDFPIALWGAALISLAVASAASLFVRYRRAAPQERAQIRWLLYACALFVANYVPGWWISDMTGIVNDVWNMLFSLTILGIPIAIAVAILRYRVWDIDIIIRRTLVYSLLTALLALAYFGSIILLQQLFTGLTGQQSPLALVLSTLAIAALFAPLRRRVQDTIDRRFYRRKYDAAKALAAFAATVRDETDLDRLAASLLATVQETVQPEHVTLWLRQENTLVSEGKG